MSDIVYKATFTTEEVLAKKQVYLEIKQSLVAYLREVADIIDNSGETPITGDRRKALMDKFNMIDRHLLHKFDSSSFAYFEATENQQG